MHDWFSLSYFSDDLPVKRQPETGFHTLAQLKEATGNAIRPFLSAIRPRQPPPNLPMPNILPPHMMPIGDSFRNLAIHNNGFPSDPRMNPGQPGILPPFAQQPFRNDAPFSPNHYGPQQGFLPNPIQSPGYLGNPGQTWGGMQPGAGNRFNAIGGFGAPAGPGMGQLPGPFQQGAFSPAIGGPIGRAPDFFSPSIGAGAPGSIPASPWAQQQQPQLHQMYPPQQQQQQQQQQPQQPQQQQPQQHDQYQPQQQMDQQWQQHQQQHQQQQSEAPGQQAQPSYFPQVEEQQAQAPSEPQFEEEQPAFENASQETAEPKVPAEEASEAADTIEEPAPAAPPVSAWGAVPASRRSSLAAEQTPASPATTKASAPASTKPASSRKPSIAEAPVLAPVVATPERSSNTPKPAPWAVKDDKEVKTPSGPSLREIQEAEAKAAEARNKAIAELRANNAVSSPAPSSNEDMITSMSWGLPTQNSKAPQVSSPSVNSPSAPAWGAGDSAGPKKTMKQIQEEEEKRRAKLAQAKAQAQAQVTSANPGASASANTKRGYADLAATSAPSSGSGWQTVGAKAVPGSAAPAPAVRPAAPAKSAVVAPPKPAAPAPAVRTVKANGGSSDDSTPSVEFVRWAKQSLNGLNVNSELNLPQVSSKKLTCSRRLYSDATVLPHRSSSI
jgi:PERQ amino acid-rich with GYF domain-containing protein